MRQAPRLRRKTFPTEPVLELIQGRLIASVSYLQLGMWPHAGHPQCFMWNKWFSGWSDYSASCGGGLLRETLACVGKSPGTEWRHEREAEMNEKIADVVAAGFFLAGPRK
jgi:hypothetical protein